MTLLCIVLHKLQPHLAETNAYIFACSQKIWILSKRHLKKEGILVKLQSQVLNPNTLNAKRAKRI